MTSNFGLLTYNPPAGGFAFLLSLAGLAALPLVGRLTDLVQFRRFLEWRRLFHPRHTILGPGEEGTAWREYRGYRWPSFYQLGVV